jgi:zinc protease
MGGNMKRIAIVAVLWAGTAAFGSPPSPAHAPRAAAPPAVEKAFPFTVDRKTLPNGLHLCAIHYDSPGLIAYYSIARTGSRNEVEPKHTGFAHFFEHMMFRGTEKYPADRYNEIVKEIGADSNAFTSDDLTVYHLLAGKESLPTIVDIEADRFQHLKYSNAAFQKESRAILGEYNKGASNPFQPLDEKIRDLAFTTHTYKHTTIGFIQDVENMPNEYDYSRQFFERYYRPDNVQVIVAGDVDAARFFALAEKAYGGWQKGGGQRPEVPAEPPQKKEERGIVPWKSASLPILFMGYHTPAFSTTSKDGPALDVLSELLFSDRAPLHKRLVLDEQKVDDLEGGAENHRDPFLFEIVARVKQQKDVPVVEKDIESEIAKIAAKPPDAKSLKETVSHLRYAFARNLNTADRVAVTAAYAIALTGNPEAFNAYYAMFSALTPEDISVTARKYFTPSNRTVVQLQPPAEKPAKGEAK